MFTWYNDFCRWWNLIFIQNFCKPVFSGEIHINLILHSLRIFPVTWEGHKLTKFHKISRKGFPCDLRKAIKLEYWWQILKRVNQLWFFVEFYCQFLSFWCHPGLSSWSAFWFLPNDRKSCMPHSNPPSWKPVWFTKTGIWFSSKLQPIFI